MMNNIVVLISGNGSNLQAIIDAITTGDIQNANISLVISNRKAAFGLQRASQAHIPTLVHSLKGKDRQIYDQELADKVLSASPALVVLAGFMHIRTLKCDLTRPL